MNLLASTGAPFARVLSIASALPSRVVDNAEMCTYIESSDEWIQQRTGIVERRWLGEGETALSLAVDASTKAIERAGLEASDIDAVVVPTVSQFVQTPALAPLLAAELGLDDPAAYDVAAGCAGFCYGIAQAEALVRSGAAEYVLVCAVEALSQIADLTDRGTAFLFADGAGAAIVGGAQTNGIGPVVWGSDGHQADAIFMTRTLQEVAETGEPSLLHMDGRAVFKWATTFVSDAAAATLQASGLSPEELDVFAPHQANNRITDAILRHLKLPEHVTVARTVRHFGNTSAASVPMALDAMLAGGEAKSGDKALLIGFGSGLVYAGQVIELP